MPTGTIRRSSATDNQPLTPPPTSWVQTIRPSLRLTATRVPSSRTVTTRSPTTAAPPSGSPGTGVDHTTDPSVASTATNAPSCWPNVAPKYAVWSGERVTGAFTTAAYTTPSAVAGGVRMPPKVPGATSVGPS